MGERDDLDDLRLDRSGLRVPDPTAFGGPAFVGRNATASPVVGHFILVHPVRVLGVEVEGGLPIKSVDTSVSLPVYLLGPGIPALGDDLICRRVRHRWVAERKGSAPVLIGPGNILGCPCQALPARIAIHPLSEGCDGGTFYSDTLVWQPRPAAYASLGTLDPGYYGTGTFLDGAGSSFQFFFTCSHGDFTLGRLYPGPPAILDSVRWSWPIGVPGNSCSPFSLTVGTAADGAPCGVTAAEAP